MDDYRDEFLEITRKCERLYPETTSEFKDIMKKQYLLFCKTQLNNIENINNKTTYEDIKIER